MVARLVMPDGNARAVQASLDMCEKHCDDDACRDYVAVLKARRAGEE